ncbi:MAG: type II toxin-antitoxin system Phd/YefM family antitoxin [Nitrospinae bacterium]|nr:type II toxin-antitoxin system Phd/YefM family antitoxin [Nitrospinota bacterium]
MIKKISAVKIRQNLGQVMNEVTIKGDDYIVERAGKPLVAIVSMTKYRHLQEARSEFFGTVKEIRKRAGAKGAKAAAEAIREASLAAKKQETKTRLR